MKAYNARKGEIYLKTTSETSRLHCTFMLTHGILVAIPTAHFSSHSLAPFSEHPLRHRVLESPLQAWQPRSTFPGYPYPRSSGISAAAFSLLFFLDILPCVECRIHDNRDFSPKIQCRVIWISKVLQSLTRRESRDFFPHVECKERFIMDGNRKVRCQTIH